MSWTIRFCVTLVLTSLSGTIAFLVWKAWAAYMEHMNKLRWIYPMLAIVELFFVLPLGYGVAVLWQSGEGWTSALRGYAFRSSNMFIVMGIAGIAVWLAGVLFFTARFVRKLWHMNVTLRRGCIPPDLELAKLCDEVCQRIGIRQRVQVGQSYMVETAAVIGVFRKLVVVPAKRPGRRETEIMLSHELMHVKQGILPLKGLGALVKVVYWFDPLVHDFMRELDEWGETACDVAVRYETDCVEDFQEYFHLVVDGVEEQKDLPDEWTQLRKAKGVHKRLMRIRHYKRENDWKLAGGIAAMLVFCMTCTTTVAAAGVGIGKGYNEIYQSTISVTDESEGEDGVVEYEEIWDPSAQDVVVMPSDQKERASGYIGWYVPPYTLYRTPDFYVTKGGAIYVSATGLPAGNSFIVGILTPDSKKRYVTSTGGVYHAFDVTVSGYYSVFVENLSSVTLETTGYYVY